MRKAGNVRSNRTKDEMKDEMKNKISMALKDSVLQQGFEIICKNLAEHEKENEELKEKISVLLSCKAQKQLTKAKEIIKKFLGFANNTIEFDPEHPQEHTDLWNELCEKAEQFLNEARAMEEQND